MMQAFDALFGGQRAGAARGGSSDAPRTSNAQDDANATGGFERMLQAQGSHTGAGNAASRMTQASAAKDTTNDAGTRDAGRSRASEASRSSEDAPSSDTKTKDSARETSRADAKDDATRGSADAKDEADAAPASPDGTAASENESTAPAPTANAADTTTPALPEQMLALLNGLAGATAAPVAAAPAIEAPPPGLLRGDPATTTVDPRGGNAAAPVLPTLTGAQPAAAAPVEGNATTAFAMAMGAAVSGDPKTTDTLDAGLDTTAIGDATPTSPLSVSAMTNHPLSRATAAAVQANAPLVLDDGFDDGFSSRIAWMADQKVGHAEIRVTPDHLGAIDVRLQLDGNRVNAEFNSAQPDVRHALESSLPRLRDMLGQQGLQLGQADVGQRQAQQQGANGSASPTFGGSDRGDAANAAGAAGGSRGPTPRASRGLLDEYA